MALAVFGNQGPAVPEHLLPITIVIFIAYHLRYTLRHDGVLGASLFKPPAPIQPAPTRLAPSCTA
jgi:hypothetical protein